MRALLVSSEGQNGGPSAAAQGAEDIGRISSQIPPPDLTQSSPAISVAITSQPQELPKLNIPRVSFDSDGSGDELERDALNRQRIRPKLNTIQCEDRVLKVIKHNINSHYDGPWVSFSRVPRDIKELWWKEFQKQYFWKDRHATKIKANWRSKCSQHIRNTFHGARRKDQKPPFVSPENWVIMKRFWATDDKFKHVSETNQKNRVVEGPNGFSNYTAGSISVVENVEKIEKESGKRMTQEELIMAMYYSKKKGKYIDDKAQKTLDVFHSLCEKWMESHSGEAMPQEVINNFWLQASESEKMYGQRSLHRKMDNVFNPAASQAPPLIGNPPIGTSPRPLEEGVQPRPRTSPTHSAMENPRILASSPSLELVHRPPPTSPPPYYPSPPSPQNASLLAQVAPSSNNENQTQRELEYYRNAHQQQKQMVQQLLCQISQGGMQRMDTNRSVVSSAMQDNMTFQELMNLGGENMDGVNPRATGSYFPSFYGKE